MAYEYFFSTPRGYDAPPGGGNTSMGGRMVNSANQPKNYQPNTKRFNLFEYAATFLQRISVKIFTLKLASIYHCTIFQVESSEVVTVRGTLFLNSPLGQ